MVFHEDGQQKRELLIDEVVFTFPFLSEEALQLSLSNLNLLIRANQNDVSEVIG
jgi:hypothetical protein